MCTSITLQTTNNENFFSRTMDLSYAIDPELLVVPKGFEWHDLLAQNTIKNKYQFMGIGQTITLGEGKAPKHILVDGVNEKGFAAATLYFPGYAYYPKVEDVKDERKILSLEIVHYLLGNCANVDEAESVMKEVCIVSVPNPVTKNDAPLHWIITDKTGKTAVIEQTINGLQIMENPVGVLTNSPDFNWHVTNLRNYMNNVPHQQAEVKWEDATLKPFGNAAGTDGLPGGYAPPARFVRTAFQRAYCKTPENSDEAVSMSFHLLEGVSLPKGIVYTANSAIDYTRYTAVINTATGEYFIKTYDNQQIYKAKMPEQHVNEITSLGKINKPVSYMEF